MSYVIRAFLFFALGQAAWGDTVHLRQRGSEINGTVTFSDGVFRIIAHFKKGPREISIGRDQVSEVRFNSVTDNPEDDAQDWMLHLSTESRPPSGDDVVRFWDQQKKDVNGTLDAITNNEVSVQSKPNKQSINKHEIRSVLLSE